jgi:superfamily I DNA/RNA helicase
MTDNLFDGLNEPQQQAVQAVDGPVLVLAGPGSGKTRVLTHRIAYLIHEVGVDPFHIMAVTFTNKAAREMRERLDALIGDGKAQALSVGTFHSLCARILRRDIERLGRERDFAVYDSDDQERLMRRVLRDLNLDEKQYAPRAVHARISSAKNELVGPAEYAHLNRAYYDTVVARCYERYQALLRESNALDFDDLLVETVRLFEEHPDVLERYQNRYVYLLVDEYQDTNRAQYSFIKLLAARRRNLFAVGDEDQCVPAGSLIRTPDGEQPIERINVGDYVVAGAGRGTTMPARVTAVRSKPYSGKLIRATLASGHVFEATPNHMCFARLALHSKAQNKATPLADAGSLIHFVAFGGQQPSETYAWYGHHLQVQPLSQSNTGEAVAPRSLPMALSSWEMARVADTAEQIARACDAVDVARWAALTTGDAFAFQPAAHLRPTMIVPVWQEGRLVEDEIVSIEHIDYKGEVFDLNVEHLHNYIANSVATHNSVYGWRGADVRNILQFERDYPDAKVILLEQNYRSTQSILDVASSVIKGGGRRKHEKNLWTTNGSGLQVELHEGFDQNEESRWVAEEINRLVASGDYSYGDCAVMYRTNAQSRALEEALIARSVRYQIVGGTRFYERKEIKDVMAYLRLAYNPYDSVSLGRVLNTPARGIGERTESELTRLATELGVPVFHVLRTIDSDESAETQNAKLKTQTFNARTRNALVSFRDIIESLIEARKRISLPELIEFALERLAFREYLQREYASDEADDRWANVLELLNVAGEYVNLPLENQLPTFLEEVALVSDIDSMDKQTDVVTCITLHQAKGLEYPIVFLIGLEEGLVPHSRSLDDKDQLDEERRLLYVGATRAKQRLYLLYAFRRTSFGRTNNSTPSRFLADIPRELLKRPSRRGSAPMPQTSMFSSRSSFGEPGRKEPPPSRSSRPTERSKPAAPTAISFFAGQRVRHGTFGEGVVVSSKLVDGDEEVVVTFGDRDRRLLASFARLERIDED